MKNKLYAERDAIALGQFYVDHVCAMTAEGLHEKSDITAELAWRDAHIQMLQEDLDHQYERKIKARHQRDAVTAKLEKAQAENLRLVRVIIGTDDSYKMLPSTPTIEMIAELGFNGDTDLALGHAAISKEIEDSYKRMLQAAPKFSFSYHA